MSELKQSSAASAHRIAGQQGGERVRSRILEEQVQKAIADGHRRLQMDAFGQHGIGGRLWRAGEETVSIRVTGHHPTTYHYLSDELDPMAQIEHKSFHGPAGIPIGPWRSVENFTNAYVRECFLDELATATGQNPLELRLKRIKEPRLKAVLELAASKANWGDPLPDGWGRGLACFSTWDMTHTADVVELEVSEDGQVRIHRVVCAIDCGIVINPDTIKAQMINLGSSKSA